MDVRWQVEIDPWARQVLAKHWPNVERHDDIKTWPKPDTERVDCICGGFPCQDISTAGKGAGLAGARSGLFFEAMRVVRDLEPRYVLLENVAALLVRGMDAVLGELAQVGMDAVWHCVTASSVGAPHRRDRVFIIGYRPDDVADTEGHRGQESGDVDSETGKGNAPRESDGSSENVANAERGPGPCGRPAGRMGGPGEPVPGHRVGPWAPEPAVGRVANGVPRRVDRLRGLGNAVVPQVAEFVGRLLLDIHRGKIPVPGMSVYPLRETDIKPT
jgi:DNA (cytosine-5)-methyltransferase 1